MKKKLLALTLCLGMVATAMVGCGKEAKKGDEKETTKKATKMDFTVERTDYFGLEVEESDATVSAEELEKYIEADLEANSKTEELKEGVLEKGMTVNLDYKGTVDGEVYTEKTASKLVLEDNAFAIAGFVDGLVGKSVGEEFEMTLTFPDTFQDETLVGKSIVFTGKINSIVNTIIPELNDAYVQEVYSYLGITTVDAYKAEYEKNIKVNKIYSAVWPTLLENVEVKSYDSEALSKLTTEIAEQEEYSLSAYGITLEDYFEAYDTTKEEFMASCEESAKSELKAKAIVDYIAKAEGITVTDEEYAEELKKTMVAYEIETEEEFYEYFASYGYNEETFRESFLMNKVVEFVADNTVVVPDKEEETSAESETTPTE